MDFVDKMAEGARDVANTVVKATEDLVGKGRQSIELSKMKSERREAFAKLGEWHYNLEKGYVNVDDKAELISEIDEFNEKINEIESVRASEKQQRDAKREQERRQREAQNQQYYTADKEVCGACGADRIGNMNYCGRCGAKFE